MTTHPVAQPTEVLAGLVERVTFHNPDSGFCVLRAKARGHRDLVTVIGHAATISAREWITASGEWVNDRTHGQQFRARLLRSSQPTSLEGIEKYLGSGMIRGIGPAYAKKMVKVFGERVFDIIEVERDRLREVEGIGPVRARRITDAWAEQNIIREIMVFLHSHGVGTARAVRIYKTYGSDAIQVMTENPYRLAKDIRGIGFKTADAIAIKLGIEKTAMIRVRAGISLALTEATDEGHCGLSAEELMPLCQRRSKNASAGQSKNASKPARLFHRDALLVDLDLEARSLGLLVEVESCEACDRDSQQPDHQVERVLAHLGRLFALQGVFEAADGVLYLALGLVGGAFRLELGISDDLADHLLNGALGHLGRADDSVLVYHLSLLGMCLGDRPWKATRPIGRAAQIGVEPSSAHFDRGNAVVATPSEIADIAGHDDATPIVANVFAHERLSAAADIDRRDLVVPVAQGAQVLARTQAKTIAAIVHVFIEAYACRAAWAGRSDREATVAEREAEALDGEAHADIGLRGRNVGRAIVIGEIAGRNPAIRTAFLHQAPPRTDAPVDIDGFAAAQCVDDGVTNSRSGADIHARSGFSRLRHRAP